MTTAAYHGAAGRISWPAVLDEAATIVRSYDSGVTLRQLFYRLVARQLVPNTESAYKRLSATSAAARRAGSFPALIDRTRVIHVDRGFVGPTEALTWLTTAYRRDRTEDQAVSVYIGVEKNGLVELLRTWFDARGLPIVALGGYASQTYADEIADDVQQQARPAVLIYAGDFDPSGEDIQRDFEKRTDCFAAVHRIALNAAQVEEHQLPPAPGKATDSRAAAFRAKYGRLVQVELDALPPDVLRHLYEDAVAKYVDVSTFDAVLQREAAERAALERVAVTGATA